MTTKETIDTAELASRLREFRQFNLSRLWLSGSEMLLDAANELGRLTAELSETRASLDASTALNKELGAGACASRGQSHSPNSALRHPPLW